MSRARATLAEAGEFGFLARLLPGIGRGRGVLVGPGDDCAAWRGRDGVWLATTDALVEDVHFRRAWMSPRQIGRKAYLVNASDIAAMGGEPRFCLVNVNAPPRAAVRDLLALNAGIVAAARESGAAVIGGNLSRARQLSICVTLIGFSRARVVRRSGARPGDALYVTGSLGAAALGLRMLRNGAGAAGAPVRRYREPLPRLQAGKALADSGCASAMIDVSDGLLQDLGHLCRASGVGARVEAEKVPCLPAVHRAGLELALHGGEDYELLFTVPPGVGAKLARLGHRLGCRVTRIGEILPRAAGIRVVDGEGKALRLAHRGYDHYRKV